MLCFNFLQVIIARTQKKGKDKMEIYGVPLSDIIMCLILVTISIYLLWNQVKMCDETKREDQKRGMR